MLVVMKEGAAEAQIQAVIDRLVAMGFTVHRSTGVLQRREPRTDKYRDDPFQSRNAFARISISGIE